MAQIRAEIRQVMREPFLTTLHFVKLAHNIPLERPKRQQDVPLCYHTGSEGANTWPDRSRATARRLDGANLVRAGAA